MGLDFWPTYLRFPILCVHSISTSVIASSRCSFIVATHRSSVFSFLFSGMPCNNKQLRLEYCSCLWTWLERLSTHLDMLVKHSSSVLILSSFSFLSFSYSSNLLKIKSIASISSAKCFSPLINPSFNSFVFSKICVICLTFLMQLNKMLTQSGNFKLSVNTLLGMSLALLVFRLPSFNFLLLSSWFELSHLTSRFFEFRSKYFVISVRLMIILTCSNSV